MVIADLGDAGDAMMSIGRNMKRDKWLAIAVAVIGLLNVTSTYRVLVLNRVLSQMNAAGPSQQLAIEFEGVQKKLKSGEVEVTPTAEAGPVRRAVALSVIQLRQETSEYDERVELSQMLFRTALIISGVQLLLAAGGFFLHRRATKSA